MHRGFLELSIHTFIYIYLYIFVCVCVPMYMVIRSRESLRTVFGRLFHWYADMVLYILSPFLLLAYMLILLEFIPFPFGKDMNPTGCH